MITGAAAGVPFVARPPDGGERPDAPVVVAWHLLDAPRTEAAFAAAVPLAGLDAWRIYLGLPLCGARLPEGGCATPSTGWPRCSAPRTAGRPRRWSSPSAATSSPGPASSPPRRCSSSPARTTSRRAIVRPVATAVDALRRQGATVAWRTVPGMAHALAEEPGVAPAPQTPHAAEVDGHAAAWFTARLRRPAGDPTTAGRESAPA